MFLWECRHDKTNMKDLQELLAKNKAWAEAIKANDPEFFNTLAQQQTPRYLWIGCSDSRVPATQLVGLRAGDLFVHRNVANVVVHTDDTLRLDKLCEFNVIEQVLNVSRTTIVQKAWSRGQELAVHGWIYGVGDGLLRDLNICITNQNELSKKYEAAVSMAV